MNAPQPEELFRKYYRNLPHWRARGYPVFVTWRLDKSQAPLTNEERSLVTQAFWYFDRVRYELTGYVVMDDHAHVLFTPDDKWPLEKICHSWKSFTAHEMVKQFHRSGRIWQDEYFDRLIRNEEEFYQKARYILANPHKRWPELERYEWVWVKGMSIPEPWRAANAG